MRIPAIGFDVTVTAFVETDEAVAAKALPVAGADPVCGAFAASHCRRSSDSLASVSDAANAGCESAAPRSPIPTRQRTAAAGERRFRILCDPMVLSSAHAVGAGSSIYYKLVAREREGKNAIKW